MKRILLYSVILFASLFIGCKKEEADNSDIDRHPLAAIDSVFNVTASSATVKCSVSIPGGDISTFKFGVQYALDKKMSSEAMSVRVLEINRDGKSFEADLSPLSPETLYWCRPYLEYFNGNVIYGEAVSFRTKTAGITVTTLEASGINSSSANIFGRIDADGKLSGIRTAYFKWGLSAQSLNHTVEAQFDGSSFFAPLSSLSPGTTYYFKAFCKVGEVEYAGEVLFFETKEIEVTVTTLNATGITEYRATLNGSLNVVAQDYIVRFFYAKDISDPERLRQAGTEVVPATQGSGSFSFSYEITSLERNTTYYYIAAASLGDRTVYGNVTSFNTKDITAMLSTDEASGITETRVTLGGSLLVNTTESIERSVSFLYSKSASSLEALKNSPTSIEAALTGNGTFSCELTGIDCNTTYYYVAAATLNDKTVYGDVKSFTTKDIVATVSLQLVSLSDEKMTCTLSFTSIDAPTKSVKVYYSPTETSSSAIIASGFYACATSLTDSSFTAILPGLTADCHCVAVATLQGKNFVSDVVSISGILQSMQSFTIDDEDSLINPGSDDVWN